MNRILLIYSFKSIITLKFVLMKYQLLFGVFILFGACSSSTDSSNEENEVLYKVDIHVLSATSWSEENPEYNTVSEANITIFKKGSNSPDRAISTNNSGTAIISENSEDEVCIIVEKNGESNIVKGYVIKGIFESLQDINSHAAQENSNIGELMFYDLNADGIVNENDQASCQPIQLSLTNKPPFTIYLASS